MQSSLMNIALNPRVWNPFWNTGRLRAPPIRMRDLFVENAVKTQKFA
jgi:hypothetical protein